MDRWCSGTTGVKRTVMLHTALGDPLRDIVRPRPAMLSFLYRPSSHTKLMDELEKLRKLVGPEADHWTVAQLEQLSGDMDMMATLLFDLYRVRGKSRDCEPCESREIDVPRTDG